MSTALESLLAAYRDHAVTEREKGTYFENLSRAYLENDPEMTGQFGQVWTFAEWAAEHGRKATDTGIDLVAEIKGDDGGFCAIQCKFYAEDHRIQKSDIDSFFTASGKSWFARRLIIDSTAAAWSKNAEDALSNQNPPVTRRSLIDLANSAIDWSAYHPKQPVKLQPKKSLRPHQTEALDAVRDGLKDADRGKLIMACGTGKTFTGLKIAEDLAGAGRMVLFLVPSLALMAQTVREWTLDTGTKLRAFAVCSDVQVGKRKLADDLSDLEIHDLAFPATTNAAKLASKIDGTVDDAMTVVFATYQSIQVISDAQKKHGLPEFDLIICDEAHRTTGATIAGDDESNFVRIHKQEHVRGKKRVYMTATPRIFGEGAKRKASEHSVEVASMDDPDLYGEVLFHRGFSWAVQQQLLTDYKVIVLAVDEGMVSRSIQQRLSASNEIQLDDATKIIGCYKALIKDGLKVDVSADPLPMKRALAFCKSIKASQAIQNEFAQVVNEYLDGDDLLDDRDDGASSDQHLRCEVNHVDGTFGAKERGVLLDWIKADAGADTCRILTNARCLSEGVDVPSLDAIMFLHPRKSQIDVVQSVGRVMRRAEGKKMGYVILPVGVPAGVAPEDALNDNERYKVVWQILNALRAHDERFDATVNKIELGEDVSDRLQVIGVGAQTSEAAEEELRATTAVVEDLPDKRKPSKGSDIGGGSANDDDGKTMALSTGFNDTTQAAFVLDEFSNAIKAKIVKKCGTRDYWEDWATDIAKIAEKHITRITGLLEAGDPQTRAAFDGFLAELRDDLNDSISEAEAIEMLAQHLITRPVFEALFDGSSFVQENPVSKAMQGVLGALDTANVQSEAESLQKFYDSVKWRAQGIETAHGKQQLIVQLYDKFFRNAFPRMTERLGIVYTPVEVVDFIIHSVNDVLKAEFGQTLGSKGVHIIDPFTGTGTFITRLLQSGLIKPEEMAHKYRHEIHANEIVLLAYYIAAINIEATYHAASGANGYEPFEGICLTDTFQLYEQDRDLIADLMPENSDRRARQKNLDIRVIMGNPPYSAGQGSANDNAANVKYPKLDEAIRSAWAERSSATNKNALYDSYIRAIRWGADRLKKSGGGVMAYVSNGGWIDGNAMDGMRKALPEEFSSIHVFHLRGNQRTLGERSRKEGGKIFDSGSRAPIAITVFVRNPEAAEQGVIRFHDIGDYLTRDEKLATIKHHRSIDGLTRANAWQPITPNEAGDWINQRDDSFDVFMPMGDKKGDGETLFANFSAGVKTQRDAWAYNASKDALTETMKGMIGFYSAELKRLAGLDRKQAKSEADYDPKKISWSDGLFQNVEREKSLTFDASNIVPSIYRPYESTWLYYSPDLNERRYQMPRLFPDVTADNRVIVCKMRPETETSGFALMVDRIIDLQPDGGTQCFPLHLYDPATDKDDLFADEGPEGYTRRDGITDAGLAHFRTAYPGEAISKEDIFYYVYGLLHSPDYRERYADTLTKQLPRIPRVKSAADFWAFSKAGRALGDLHVNYETVEPYPVNYDGGALLLDTFTDADFRVEKMKFGGKGRNKDKSVVIYNPKITMTGIPLEAYDYIVNGKPALEWVMERQSVKVDKASGIVNDANDYAIETVGDARYPLMLFQRVITVSLETMKIVRGLPRLDFNTLS